MGQSINRPSEEYQMLGVEVQESEFEESGEEDATAIESHTHTP